MQIRRRWRRCSTAFQQTNAQWNQLAHRWFDQNSQPTCPIQRRRILGQWTGGRRRKVVAFAADFMEDSRWTNMHQLHQAVNYLGNVYGFPQDTQNGRSFVLVVRLANRQKRSWESQQISDLPSLKRHLAKPGNKTIAKCMFQALHWFVIIREIPLLSKTRWWRLRPHHFTTTILSPKNVNWAPVKLYRAEPYYSDVAQYCWVMMCTTSRMVL